MQGDLTSDALGDVIRKLYVNRRSGILHLSQNGIQKRIYFRKGSMIFANSDVENDRLGEFLIRQQVIDRDAFERASRVMRETGQRFGRTLVELGLVAPDALEGRVVEQIQTIIYSLFHWGSGAYGFQQHENPVDEDIVLNLSTADIILEGTRRMEDMAKIRRALGDPGRILQTTEDALLRYQKMTTLSHSEFFIFSRVDGQSSIDDILSISPIGEDETLRCLYGLVSAGVLEPKGSPQPERRASEASPEARAVGVGPHGIERAAALSDEADADVSDATPATDPHAEAPPESPPPPPGVEIPRPDIDVRTAASEPAKARTDAPAEPSGPTPEEIAVKNDIVEKHASLSEATLYDLLGVAVTAGDGEIKRAYYAMAKRYHPDRHHSPHLRDVHGLLEELFGKITGAYQTLSSPSERNQYDSRIRPEGAAPAGAAGPGGPVTVSDEASEGARKKSAEDLFREGKRHFDEMHFFDAIQCLKEAIRLHPKRSYHKLLAQALMKNPKWLREAEEHFRIALKMDPFDAECYLGLGEIYESEGMATRAQKMYEQAATYNPESEAVQKKLGSRRGVVGVGTLKKLFTRKKD